MIPTSKEAMEWIDKMNNTVPLPKKLKDQYRFGAMDMYHWITKQIQPEPSKTDDPEQLEVDEIWKDFDVNKLGEPTKFVESSIPAGPEPSVPVNDGWVDTRDRLPDLGERVLCATTDFGVQTGFLRAGGWSFSNGATQDIINHWMPLPNPPKK